MRFSLNRKIAVFAVVFVTAATFAYAHSPMNRFWGDVPVDMELGGDVLIVKTLVVPEDVTLTIEAGTVVRFEDTGGDNAIVVKGRLVAAGTKDAVIRFVPKDEKSGPWRGIVFDGGTGLLTNCEITGATEGVVDPGNKVVQKGVVIR